MLLVIVATIKTATLSFSHFPFYQCANSKFAKIWRKFLEKKFILSFLSGCLVDFESLDNWNLENLIKALSKRSKKSFRGEWIWSE